VECEFPNSTLNQCRLEYSTWRETAISSEQVLANLPDWPNVAHSLAEALRVNALSRGDGAGAREFFLEAARNSQAHFRRIAFARASYYRQKYKGWIRVSGFLRWLGVGLERWGWGFGESPIILTLWALVSIVLFAVLYLSRAPTAFGSNGEIDKLGTAFLRAVEFSALCFATSAPTRMPGIPASLFLLETFLGIVFTGVLAAVVFRWISIRQG